MKDHSMKDDSVVSFSQLNNKPLRERIVDLLRDAILHGELKPGQALVETELASQLGVSRAPIREALQRLISEGLLETIPYHATTVRKLTRRDIEELYSLRRELEAFALRRVHARGNPDDLAILRGCCDEMLEAADAGDIKTLNQVDRRFHDTIIHLSHHNLLASLWNTVSLRVRQVMALRNRHFQNLKEIALNHLPIIEALEADDIETATQLLKDHIDQIGDLLVNDWILDEDENDGS